MYFDKRRAAKPLLSLFAGNQVWLRERGAADTVLRPSDAPRSYWVKTRYGAFRRNRRPLFLLPDENGDSCPAPEPPQPSKPADTTKADASKPEVIMPPSKPGENDHLTAPTTQSGRVIKALKRLGIND